MISVIIPVYNKNAYLDNCLRSIVSQKVEWECVLVDDGSTDGSSELCEKWGESDARFVVIHQKNQGVSVARNTGIDASKGEWLYFLDADDICVNLTLDGISEESDLILGSYSGGNNIIKALKAPSLAVENYPYSYLKESVRCRMGSYAVKRTVLEESHIRFTPGCQYGEDLEFNFRVLLNARRVSVSDKVFCLYRQNECSVSRQLTLAKFDVFFGRLRLVDSLSSGKNPQALSYLTDFSLCEAVIESARALLRGGMKVRTLKHFFNSKPEIVSELRKSVKRKSLSWDFRMPALLLLYCPAVYKSFLFLQNLGYNLRAFLGKAKRKIYARNNDFHANL